MNPAMISAISGGLAAMERFDAIATNLANIGTTGFKSLLQMQSSTSGPRAAGAAAGEHITRSATSTDFSQGPVEQTGDPLNVALSGEGFLMVATPDGERLTRRGVFSLNEEGVLVTGDGHAVQGDGGEIQLGDALAQGDSISIGSDGSISVGNDRVGRLRVVEVEDQSTLTREGGGLFIPRLGSVREAEEGSFNIVQGALEASNVSPVEALVQMIEATRGFEAYMTALQRLDGLQQKAIGEVGRVA